MRRQQAAHWKLYEVGRTPRDAVIYRFFFDPAGRQAPSYDPIKILSEERRRGVAACSKGRPRLQRHQSASSVGSVASVELSVPGRLTLKT